jgi:Zn-dependent protease with chaperone function
MAITADGEVLSMTVSARFYGDGAPPAGESAEIELLDAEIEVRTASAAHRVAIGQLQFRSVGTARRGLELAWNTERGGRSAAHVFEPDLERVTAHPALRASPQMNAMRAEERRQGVRRSIGWTAIGVWLAFPLILLLVFVLAASRIAGALAERVSLKQEVALGDQAFARMRGSLTLLDTGPDYAAVTSLGERLTRGSRYQYRFHVVKDGTLNAFALPGGIIAVHTGLIAATRTPEELAGVLAHEVQHVELRHSLRGMMQDLGLRGLWALATGDLGGSMAGGAAVALASLKFSRDTEAQADAKGFDALVASGIDPVGMADFFAVLGTSSGAAPPAFLSTHPPSQDREQRLRARRAELKDQRFEPLAFGTWPPTPKTP